MPDRFVNRLSCGIVNTPGTTGAFTIGVARTGFRAFRAADDGLTFTVLAEQVGGWEVRNGCLYTHATTSLSRGTLEDSSTGSAISFTAAALVTVTISARQAIRLGGTDVLVTNEPTAAGQVLVTTGLATAEWQTYTPGTGGSVDANAIFFQDQQLFFQDELLIESGAPGGAVDANAIFFQDQQLFFQNELLIES